VSESGAGPPPVPIAALTAETLAEAITFALRPDVRARAAALGERMRAEKGDDAAVAAFYRRLPLASMQCRIDARHLARYRCTECGIVLCRMCDAVIHDEPARASHRRGLLGHVGWDAAGSPSLADRLERVLCDPVAARDMSAPTHVDDSPAIPGAVVHDEDSVLAKCLRRLPPERRLGDTCQNSRTVRSRSRHMN
jgi:hypothetical protein